MIENQYETRIQEIFVKYCKPLYKNNVELLEQRMEQQIKPYSAEPWAVFGVGGFTKTIFKYLDFPHIKNFQGFFDNNKDNWGTEFLGSFIINPETLVDSDVKTVFNFTLSYHKEIEEQVHKLNPQIKVIDFVTELEFSDYDGYQLGYTYLNNKDQQYPKANSFDTITYLDLYIYKRLYETTEEAKKKKEFLENIISCYVWMRDFLNTFLYIDEYITAYGTGHYDLLKKELEALLKELRTALQKREYKDILLVLLDSLSTVNIYDKKDFSYLNQLKQAGTFYSSAYSPGLCTSDSTSSTWRKLPVVQLPKKEGPIFLKDVLKEQGYGSAASFSHNKLLINSSVTDKLIYAEQEIFDETRQSEMLSKQYWYGVTSIASENHQHFFHIHAVNETHPPFYVGAFQTEGDMYPPRKTSIQKEEKQEYLMKRISDVYTYVDRQSEFYLSMLSEKSVKVIFADHGRHIESNYLVKNPFNILHYDSENYHVPLILHGADIPKKQVNSIFSTMYLTDLLGSLIDSRVTVPEQTFAQVGFYTVRNSFLRNKILDSGYHYGIDGFNLFLDEEYKMVRNAHGECRYYIMGNETEEIDDPEIIAVIHERFGHLFTDDEYFDIT